ncbi:hypothetical protein EPR50_G00059750 [Perca flavescens]|uniref:Uncharacterized protein n=1 Tax=Perca flavescens TaxID=8167 RepID=A0A484D7H3_PERFV|nr:hypothetical protein EPR50_G00059750 [Perca flavescens]
MGGGINNPLFFSPDDEKAAERAALRRAFVCVSATKCPKHRSVPSPTKSSRAEPSRATACVCAPHAPPASTTTTPPSPSPTAVLWQWSRNQPHCALTEPSVWNSDGSSGDQAAMEEQRSQAGV